ncbi:hypothetical protein M2254_001376 [Chryseobacterium sp. BIGb0186]|nr:hypothetical protein [Chryseobacterium sp. BIGb0186]
MSLKIYTLISSLIFLLILLIFSILTGITICIVQLDFQYLILYIFRIINHIFEAYYLVCVSILFVLLTLITYHLKKSRSLIFIFFISFMFGVIFYEYDLRSIFIYKSQPLDRNFYTYFISYTITTIIGYIMFKKTWKYIEDEK